MGRPIYESNDPDLKAAGESILYGISLEDWNERQKWIAAQNEYAKRLAWGLVRDMEGNDG